VSVTPEEIAREKDRLPRGWGRFGKSLDMLAEIGEADESLLSSCVALNPEFKHKSRSLPGGLLEMTDATNVVLAATDKRLIVLATGMGGAPRKHYVIAYDGLQIADRQKKEFTLRLEDTSEIRFRGAAKQEVPGFLEAVEANAR
jgi:Bacterial PH domain